MVTMEFYGVKLMASTSQITKKTWSEVDHRSQKKQITTLPKGLIGMIRGLANPGLTGVGQKVHNHTPNPVYSLR